MLPAVHWWVTQASGGGKVANVDHDRPYFVVTQGSPGAGHSRGPYTVVDDPFQLAIGILLHFSGRERRQRRRHSIGEWNPGASSVKAVTRCAIVRKRFLAIGNGLRVGLQGISLFSSADRNMVFPAVHQLRFNPGRPGPFESSQNGTTARGEPDARDRSQEKHTPSSHFSSPRGMRSSCFRVLHRRRQNRTL